MSVVVLFYPLRNVNMSYGRTNNRIKECFCYKTIYYIFGDPEILRPVHLHVRYLIQV